MAPASNQKAIFPNIEYSLWAVREQGRIIDTSKNHSMFTDNYRTENTGKMIKLLVIVTGQTTLYVQVFGTNSWRKKYTIHFP